MTRRQSGAVFYFYVERVVVGVCRSVGVVRIVRDIYANVLTRYNGSERARMCVSAAICLAAR